MLKLEEIVKVKMFLPVTKDLKDIEVSHIAQRTQKSQDNNNNCTRKKMLDTKNDDEIFKPSSTNFNQH